MAGLDPAIQDFQTQHKKSWMTGSGAGHGEGG
jgi:hypothetical protein